MTPPGAAGTPPEQGEGSSTSSPSRRDLLAAIAAAGATVGCLAHGALWMRALSPRVLYEPPTVRRIGQPSRFPPGITFLKEEQVFVLRGEDGSIRALSAVCTHLGCTVDREGEGFHCPCHGSQFDATGKNVAGPAPRPLPWRRLTLAADGALVVDLASEVAPDVAVRVETEGDK